MLPFAYSLGLPLLAGGIPPTWSLVSGTTPDLSTNEAAGTLYLGTRFTDAPVQSAARVVPQGPGSNVRTLLEQVG